MVADWDLYVDEVKDGGAIEHLGVLFVQAGAGAMLQHLLLKEKNQLQGSGKLGEVHWNDLKDRETELAEKWLNVFMGGPLMFFARADPPATSGSSTKRDLVENLVTHMEQSPHVPHGLCRSQTTIHIDLDESDGSRLLAHLRQGFGLLRAFHWDSRGSLLLQLSDLLLGVSVAESTGCFPRGTIPDSVSAQRKARLVEAVRTGAATGAKFNAIMVLANGRETYLFRHPLATPAP